MIGLQEKYNWWVSVNHNWNQVCHAGLSASALVLGNEYPDLASKIINRAVDKLPIVLASYSPDGAYPEGPSYWEYGTTYNLLAISFFRTALGTDFNLPKAPGFMQSAVYRMEAVAPSGESFNYSDAGYGDLNLQARGSLAWFAQETGNGLYVDTNKLLALVQKAVDQDETPTRFAPVQLIWLSEFKQVKNTPLPVDWKGEGHNPIAIFRADNQKHTGFYLGVKGGSASVNHGNMDVGSFVFELHGVRWSIDPGTQNYNELEQNKHIGEALWDESQDSPRWTLLTKANQFHSTLTVNGQRHNVEGFAPITTFQVDSNPKVISLDLSEIFTGQLNKATRTFKKIDNETLRIEDNLVPSDSTRKLMWGMMTQATVSKTDQGFILSQNGKKLRLTVLEPADAALGVTSLNPPPLPYDKKIEGLKRITLTIPQDKLDPHGEKIVVELKGMQ